MRKTFASLFIVAGLVLAMSSVSLADDKWLGTWKLNVGKSKFDPGPAPQSQTITFEPAENGFKLTTQTVDAQGQSVEGGYTVKFDGKDYPWKNNANADTVSVTRIDDYTYESTWKKGGKITIKSRIGVSKDGKTLTNMQIGNNEQGQRVSHTLVFERQ